MRNRVEGPTDRAGVDVVGTHVAGGRAFLLAYPHALDEQVLVDGAGTRRNEIGVADITR